MTIEGIDTRLWSLVERQLETGNLNGAVETLREILSHDPDSADAHALLSLVLIDLKRLHAAEHEAKIALSLMPGPLPIQAAAKTALAQRKFKLAEEHYELLRQMTPEDSEPLLGLAALYQLTGRRNQALPLLEQARALSPESPDVVADLGHWYLDNGKLQQAETLAREALELEPENPEGLVLMGNVLVHSDRLDEAMEHAIWALQQNPSNRQALALLVSIKTRRSLVLGLWWRFSAWMGNLGEGRAILVLLGAYVLYRFGVITAEIQGRADLGELINVFWLGIVAYTWIGPALFLRSLKKELSSVHLGHDF